MGYPTAKTTPQLARELALLGMSQRLPAHHNRQVVGLLVGNGVTAWRSHLCEVTQNAGADLQAAKEAIVCSETRSPDLAATKSYLDRAGEYIQNSIQQFGNAFVLSEVIHEAGEIAGVLNDLTASFQPFLDRASGLLQIAQEPLHRGPLTPDTIVKTREEIIAASAMMQAAAAGLPIVFNLGQSICLTNDSPVAAAIFTTVNLKEVVRSVNLERLEVETILKNAKTTPRLKKAIERVRAGLEHLRSACILVKRRLEQEGYIFSLNAVNNTLQKMRLRIEKSLQDAASEAKRADEWLGSNKFQVSDARIARNMLSQSWELTENAIESFQENLNLPEWVNSGEVSRARHYASDIVTAYIDNESAIDSLLNDSMQHWKLSRLPKIDRDILRIAIAEIKYLALKDKIAISEAILLAKKYSDDEGRRLINGILSRIYTNPDRQKTAADGESD
jgi:transcription antitermination protein NusB